MVDDLFHGSLVLSRCQSCKISHPGTKSVKSLPRKRPTQSIKGEPSFSILEVYAFQFSWSQGKTQANQGNMSGNIKIIGYSTSMDCSQSPTFP